MTERLKALYRSMIAFDRGQPDLIQHFTKVHAYAKLIAEYRRKVNPIVNVFCVQTAGYHNVLVPEYGYRTNILYGWTGKELLFADAMIRLWDERDGRTQ